MTIQDIEDYHIDEEVYSTLYSYDVIRKYKLYLKTIRELSIYQFKNNDITGDFLKGQLVLLDKLENVFESMKEEKTE